MKKGSSRPVIISPDPANAKDQGNNREQGRAAIPPRKGQDMMDFYQAKDEMTDLAKGEYFSLEFTQFDSQDGRKQFCVYIHHGAPDRSDSKHGYSEKSWYEAIEDFKRRNPWLEELKGGEDGGE